MFVDSPMLFGRCLAVVRKAAGLTQADLARVSGMSRAALAHMETGRITPTYFLMIRLGERLRSHQAIADPSHLLSMVYESAGTLQAMGVRVVNRPLELYEVAMDIAWLDRVVGGVYEQLRPQYTAVPVQMITIDPEEVP